MVPLQPARRLHMLVQSAALKIGNALLRARVSKESKQALKFCLELSWQLFESIEVAKLRFDFFTFQFSLSHSTYQTLKAEHTVS